MNTQPNWKTAKLGKAALLMGALALLSPHATAQDARNERDQSKAEPQRQKASETRALRGEIDSVREVNLRRRDGKRETHTVIKVRLRDGGTQMVNLGTKDLNQLGLKKGDSLSVIGRDGRINDRPILMATRLKIDDESRADRSGAASGRKVVRGTLKSFRTSVTLVTQDGSTVVVNLPANHSLEDFNLQQGQKVEMPVQRVAFGGVSALVAAGMPEQEKRTRRAPGTERERQ